MAEGSAAVIRSAASGSPITPVENGSTSEQFTEAKSATASQHFSAAVMPVAPVPALALPVLMSSNRARP